MCTGYDYQFSVVQVPFVIIAFEIGDDDITRIQNEVNFLGDADLPDVDADEMDEAERGMINCTITLRKGRVREAYDKIADGARDLIIENTTTDGLLGEWEPDFMESRETIRLNRMANQEQANGYYPNDTDDQEEVLGMKVLAETYIHELCHSLGKDHPGAESSDIYSTGYYTTDMGRCERDGFVDVFGELPPSYNRVFSNTPDYTWDVQCMIDVQSAGANANFFDSLRSAAAVHSLYPSLEQVYESGPKP